MQLRRSWLERRARLIPCALALALASSWAIAGASNAAAAEVEESGSDGSAQLFREGRKLINEGRFAEACEKFRGSLALRRSPGTLLNVGNCLEAEGRLVAAREIFRESLALAAAETDARKSGLWTAAARDELAAIEERIPRLTLTVRDAAASVTLDGQPFVAFGEPVSLDPGRHRVEATAPGKQRFVSEIELGEGEAEALAVPELAASVDGTPPRAASGEAEGEAASQRASNIWPWVLLGGGGAVFAGGGVTGIVAAQMASDLDEECGSAECGARDRAKRTALAADILMVTGLAAAGAGAAWLLLSDDGASASVTAACGFQGCEAGISGRF